MTRRWALVVLASHGCAGGPDDSIGEKGHSTPDTAETGVDSGGTDTVAETADTEEPETVPWETPSCPVVFLDDPGVVKFSGIAPETGFSAFMAIDFAGDMDGDGFEEVIVGMEGADLVNGSGAAYLFRGPITSNTSFSMADATFTGPVMSFAGYSVAGAGDTNGDGLDDLLIGAIGVNDQDGAVYLALGPVSGAVDLTSVDAMLTGEVGESTKAGQAVAGAGDVNGDGFADIAVGAPAAFGYPGMGYVVLGPVSGTIDLETGAVLRIVGDSSFGMDVASAGDTNGDGLDDVLVGAPTTAAWQFNGPPSSSLTLDDADTHFIDAVENGTGYSVDGAGDVDGDGYADVVIASAGYAHAGEVLGAAFVFLGPTSGEVDVSVADATVTGRYWGEGVGVEVGGASDLDLDGHGDLLIGAPDIGYPSSGTGTTWVVYGPMTGVFSLDEADVALRGDGGEDRSGTAVAGGGDVDGDGLPDILIAGPWDADGGEKSGAAWLVYGSLLPGR